MSEFPVFPVGTMETRLHRFGSFSMAQSSNIIQASYILSNKPTWHHTTPQDMTLTVGIMRTSALWTIPQYLEFISHVELEKHTHKIGIFKNHSRTTGDPEKANSQILCEAEATRWWYVAWTREQSSAWLYLAVDSFFCHPIIPVTANYSSDFQKRSSKYYVFLYLLTHEFSNVFKDPPRCLKSSVIISLKISMVGYCLQWLLLQLLSHPIFQHPFDTRGCKKFSEKIKQSKQWTSLLISSACWFLKLNNGAWCFLVINDFLCNYRQQF